MYVQPQKALLPSATRSPNARRRENSSSLQITSRCCCGNVSFCCVFVLNAIVVVFAFIVAAPLISAFIQIAF